MDGFIYNESFLRAVDSFPDSIEGSFYKSRLALKSAEADGDLLAKDCLYLIEHKDDTFCGWVLSSLIDPDSFAQGAYLLGQAFEVESDKSLIPHSYEGAFRWYRVAADCDLAEAVCNLRWR